LTRRPQRIGLRDDHARPSGATVSAAVADDDSVSPVFTPEFIEAVRFCRHVPGSRWFVDETYVKLLCHARRSAKATLQPELA
jgi:hypothetical protein